MGKIIRENLLTLFYALLIAGLFRTLLFQPFFIPSGSMKDTLLVGDFMFVNKFAYGYSKYSCPFNMCYFSGRIFDDEPERGDIIVFRHPVQDDDYVKRLIGLPGDRIRMSNGQLFINDEPVSKVPVTDFVEPHAEQGRARIIPRCTTIRESDDACIKRRYRETLPNGVTHSTLDITDNHLHDNTKVFTVPPGEYFFMGDNRDNSLDSRWDRGGIGGLGTVPHENLIGKANYVIFSSAGRSMFYFWTWRPDRFFKALE